MGDNPGCVYQYMSEHEPKHWEFVWEDAVGLPRGAYKTVSPRNRFRWLKMIMTSGVIISNCGLGSYIPKRKGQLFINTWHGGGAYKKVGIDDQENRENATNWVTKVCGRQTDIFISSSRKFTEVMSVSKMIPKACFLECGMPRNDKLINQTDIQKIRAKVHQYYAIPEDQAIVLYAPTYRGQENNARSNWEIDWKRCQTALENRFGGKWVFMLRRHHYVKTGTLEGCIDASKYPEMQELLQAVEVLITDYSSAMWDFALTMRPGFLYTPDLAIYENERDFYTDPKTWPYSLAENNDELIENIQKFNFRDNEKQIRYHWELLGNRETGKSTEIIGDLVKQHVEKTSKRSFAVL